MPKTLTLDQRDQYETEGYCAPIKVMDPREMRAYQDRLESFERAHPDAVGKLFQGPHLLFPWLNDIIRRPSLVGAIEDLLGPNLFCISTGFRIKEPGSAKFVGWHQDAYYLKYKPVWVIALIAFTECTVENGCLKVVAGSHRGPLLHHEDTYDKNSILTQGQRIDEPFPGDNVVPIELNPGELLLFDAMMIHGSEPNRSKGRRITCFMDYCPTHTRRFGARASATLVAGVDHYNHYDHEPYPADDFGPQALALHRKLITMRNKASFVDQNRISPALQ